MNKEMNRENKRKGEKKESEKKYNGEGLCVRQKDFQSYIKMSEYVNSYFAWVIQLVHF